MFGPCISLCKPADCRLRQHWQRLFACTNCNEQLNSGMSSDNSGMAVPTLSPGKGLAAQIRILIRNDLPAKEERQIIRKRKEGSWTLNGDAGFCLFLWFVFWQNIVAEMPGVDRIWWFLWSCNYYHRSWKSCKIEFHSKKTLEVNLIKPSNVLLNSLRLRMV